MERRRRVRIGLPLTDLCGALPRGIGGIIVDQEPTPLPHLQPLADALEGALYKGEKTRFCFSAPPQHGKTALVLFGLAQALARDPRNRLAYASYASALAVDRSKRVREVASSLGVELQPDVQAGPFWRTTSGGLMSAGGVDGQWTGRGFDVAVIDDPYKNRIDAESAKYREEVESMIRIVLQRARAVIIMHTRWHPDDSIGIRADDPDWTYVNLPAVYEGGAPDHFGRKVGESLWPAVKPPEYFKEARKNPYDWASIYQGSPRPRGGTVFKESYFYARLPVDKPLKYAIGYDLGYGANKTNDWSVLVVMAYDGEFYYVLDVVRRQVEAPDFVEVINATGKRFPRARKFGWLSGTEKGAADFMNRQGARLDVGNASSAGDKFIRSMSAAAAWNDQKILLPQNNPSWIEPFLKVVNNFTGVGNEKDDDVDALAAAYHQLEPVVAGGGSAFSTKFKSRRW